MFVAMEIFLCCHQMTIESVMNFKYLFCLVSILFFYYFDFTKTQQKKKILIKLKQYLNE